MFCSLNLYRFVGCDGTSLTLICEIAPVLWADGAAVPLVSFNEGEDAETDGRGGTGGET